VITLRNLLTLDFWSNLPKNFLSLSSSLGVLNSVAAGSRSLPLPVRVLYYGFDCDSAIVSDIVHSHHDVAFWYVVTAMRLR
jgi:hypothetical protein